MHQIEIRHNGNVGNRMIQYAFADQLSRVLDPCEIVEAHVPEWGIEHVRASHRQFGVEITVTDDNLSALWEIIALARSHSPARLTLRGFFQDIDVLPSRDYVSSRLFPASGKFLGRFSSQDLVINIRAGEILSGVAWYPIIPISFYRSLVETSGLNPVFVGQVEDSFYGRQLRAAFPAAEFIRTGVALDDFELVRSAHNICIAASTFSWLAAWLSSARQIFYPLHGFLHPGLRACYQENIAPTNLAPVNDWRYRFYLLPLMYGLEQHAMYAHHQKIEGSWKAVPAAQVKAMRLRGPLPSSRNATAECDPIWYTHAHLDAALEIAEGWYASPSDHYAIIGSVRGYKPVANPLPPTGELVSRGKSATQSSSSIFSASQMPDEDASRALDGNLHSDFACHTAWEANPWWQVDLEAVYMIGFVNIINRQGGEMTARHHAMPLLVERSVDGKIFHQMRLFNKAYEFNGPDGRPMPLQFSSSDGVAARYVRLTVVAPHACLHLGQVEIYGAEGFPAKAWELAPQPSHRNIALGKPARQSSISEWSWGSVEEDASRATTRGPGVEFSFHTSAEMHPWWSVNLLSKHLIEEVRVYNRQENGSVARRLSQFQFQVSDDTLNWRPIYERQETTPVGGVVGGPLIWRPFSQVNTQHFRIQLISAGILHLNRVEIYGEPTTDHSL